MTVQTAESASEYEYCFVLSTSLNSEQRLKDYKVRRSNIYSYLTEYEYYGILTSQQ